MAIPESLSQSEATLEKGFECHDRQFLLSDFEGVDFKRDWSDPVLSEVAHLDTKGKAHRNDTISTKLDIRRDLMDEEESKHLTAAGKMKHIGTRTSPTSILSTQHVPARKKQKAVTLLNIFHLANAQVHTEKLVSLCYVLLHFTPVHIPVFPDASIPIHPEKHLQIGFVFVLADGNDHRDLFYWYSSRATRRTVSAEEAEIRELDLALLSLRNQRRIMFQLLQKKVPNIFYINNRALW